MPHFFHRCRWSTTTTEGFVTQNSGQGIRIGFARAHKYREEEEVEKAKEPEEERKPKKDKTNM